MHNIIQRPVAVDGRLEIRPMMYLALSYDHRIIDGKESVSFLVAVKEALEDPINLMDGNAKRLGDEVLSQIQPVIFIINDRVNRL